MARVVHQLLSPEVAFALKARVWLPMCCRHWAAGGIALPPRHPPPPPALQHRPPIVHAKRYTPHTCMRAAPLQETCRLATLPDFTNLFTLDLTQPFDYNCGI